MSEKQEYKHSSFRENITSTKDGSYNLLDIIINRYKRYPEEKLYGYIKDDNIIWKNAREFLGEVIALSTELSKIISKEELVGIFSINRYEWVLSQHAIYLSGGVDCPLYSTFGVSAIKHVINQTKMRLCFLTGDKAKFLLKEVLGTGEMSLKYLIFFDEISLETKEEFNNLGIQTFILNDFIKMSLQSDLSIYLNQFSLPNINDICTVCYTSGTTGNPKGVILSHKNFISILAAFDRSSGEFLPVFNEDDVHLSYLPLSHILERITQMVFLYFGGRVVFYSGNISNFIKDIQIVKPTILPGVPQIFARIQKEIKERVREKGRILQCFFNFALNYKIKRQSKGIYDSSIFDALFFNRIKEKFGGRIRGFFGGGSLIDEKHIKFMQAVFSCKMYVGYGSTETTGVISCTNPTDFLYDSIGTPFPCTKVKLSEVEDFPGKYEIWAKGDSVFHGYYQNDAATKECFSDGWFMTGDLGKYENKVLKIVGRKKDIFKTSRAEYIAPEKLEQLFMIDEIEDILVTGKPNKSYIIAIVVCLKDFSDAYIINKIKERANEAYIDKEIPSYEIPSKIVVRRESFDALGDVKTPTLKKKRGLLEEKLKDVIGKLFED